MTNYEKIMQMSVEEMAKFIKAIAFNECEYCNYEGRYCTSKDCCNGFILWLESEVTENDG